MSRTSFAPGKIILSGEYAVVFGYPGVALPSSLGIETTFDENSAQKSVEVRWENADERWLAYAKKIVAQCLKRSPQGGTLTIRSRLPLGKGMGASSALVVAIVRVLLGENRHEVQRIEETLSSGVSGFDFTTIWENRAIMFRKDTPPTFITVPRSLRDALLIDTGTPSESTTELVAWMRGREKEVETPLQKIGACSERLAGGESLSDVMREHHQAQIELGVVPSEAQALIAEIEVAGGAGKVIGAGSRTGSAGMVLALGDQEKIKTVADEKRMPTMLP